MHCKIAILPCIRKTKPKNLFFDPTTSDEENSTIESNPPEVQLPRLFTVQLQLLNIRNLIQHRYSGSQCKFLNYRLFGIVTLIVTHKGNTLRNGHYTALALDEKSNGDFYEFDDVLRIRTAILKLRQQKERISFTRVMMTINWTPNQQIAFSSFQTEFGYNGHGTLLLPNYP